MQTYGDPHAFKQIRGDDRARFWSNVKVAPSGCWLWQGNLDHKGYGRLYIKGRHPRVHRYAYELLVGPIPDGLTIDHVKKNGCTSKACVKAIADEHGPAHLEPVTNAENIRRGDPGRRWRQKTHCPYGHPYDEANTYWTKKGGRSCRECGRKASREYSRKRTREKKVRSGHHATGDQVS